MDVTQHAEEAIPSFKEDLFPERRNSSDSAGVPYDPESLLTQGEVDRGVGYEDHRVWRDRNEYAKAVGGNYNSEWIVANAPRVKGLKVTTFIQDYLPYGITLIRVGDLADGTVDLKALGIGD